MLISTVSDANKPKLDWFTAPSQLYFVTCTAVLVVHGDSLLLIP